jgi:site-specific recombinase XerD
MKAAILSAPDAAASSLRAQLRADRRAPHQAPDDPLTDSLVKPVAAKSITPHVLRHTAAMRLVHAGVDTR